VKLEAYLRTTGQSLSAFAHQAGLSEASISRYLSGKRVPRADAIRRIVRATRGRVQPEDLLPILTAPEARPGPPSPEGTTPAAAHAPPHSTTDPHMAEDGRPQGRGLDYVDLVLPDLMGVIRGKRIPARDLAEVRAHGISLPESMFSLDAMGRNVLGTGLVMEQGDQDCPVVPVDGTVLPVPWHGDGRGLMLMTMHHADGRPHFADPRTALSRVVERLAADGLSATCAVELEFFLLEPGRDAAGRPQPAGLPPGRPLAGLVDAEAASAQIQVAALHRLERFDPVLDDIARGCTAMDMVVESICAEYAPGQFEVNLRYATDPLRAADEALLFRHLVRETARRHDLHATFMSKPFSAFAGSGMHVHANLVDSQGRNIFARGDVLANRPLAQAIAGAAATMAEAMAIFAPTANAFRRFGPGSYAPVSPSWGVDNRTVALRIPGGPARARRLEHRVAGAEANPYLVLAAMLAGMHHGIAAHLVPDAQTRGDAAGQPGAKLPTDWPAALAAHDGARILPGYLGEDFWHLYGQVRRGEMDRAQAMIPDTDYMLYLDSF